MLKSLSAALAALLVALSILFLVSVSSLTVTSLPEATVVSPSSPLILNFTSPVLKDFSVVEPVSPPKEMLRAIAALLASALSSVFFNWDILTASLSATPSATLVIFLSPALMPLSPSILTVSLPDASLKDALFKPVRFFFKDTEIFLLFLATVILSSPEKSTVLPFSIASGVASPLAERFHPYLF